MRDIWNWWTIEGRKAVLIAAHVSTDYAPLCWDVLPSCVRTAVEGNML